MSTFKFIFLQACGVVVIVFVCRGGISLWKQHCGKCSTDHLRSRMERSVQTVTKQGREGWGVKKNKNSFFFLYFSSRSNSPHFLFSKSWLAFVFEGLSHGSIHLSSHQHFVWKSQTNYYTRTDINYTVTLSYDLLFWVNYNNSRIFQQ